MPLEPWEIRDPQSLLREVADQVALVEDSAWAVLVRAPATEQEIVEVRRLALPALLDDDDDIRQDLCDLVDSFGLPDLRPPRHAVVTVLARPGRCLFGPNEAVWINGWRYSNHLGPVFDTDLLLVTEHGWSHLLSECAGHGPRVVAGS